MLDWQANTVMEKVHGTNAVLSALGYIPNFIQAWDTRPIWEQINERYIGGWQAMLPGKWRLDADLYLHYPGDPALAPLASARHGQERIIVYPHAWTVILQDNGDYSIARLD